MFTTIQILLLAFAIFAISRVYLRAKEKIISPKMAVFWLIIWIAAIVGISLPATTTRVAEFFGVGRGVDVIVYISLTLLFYLVFRIYVMIEDLRHEITEIVRNIALKKTNERTAGRKFPK